MTAKRRIGEILLMQDTVDSLVLAQALKLQGSTSRQRLISLLIGRAQLEPDDGAMALSEQHGYPAALERHLDRRDPACQGLIPRALVQRWAVFPLGRARDGRLVVVARDPTPILAAALEHASKLRIELSVTPGILLERLIRSIYGVSDDANPAQHDVAMIEELQFGIEVGSEVPVRPARTVSSVLFNDGTPELPKRAPQGTERIDSTLVEIANAITSAAAERIALGYAIKRWKASLLLDVKGDSAIGRRGHGPALPPFETIVLPLGSPSTVQLAYEGRTATSHAPSSAIQLQLCHLLGDATTPTAAAIVVAGEVRSVLAVGDSQHSASGASVTDLARLADALGAAHDRLAHGSRGG